MTKLWRECDKKNVSHVFRDISLHVNLSMQLIANSDRVAVKRPSSLSVHRDSSSNYEFGCANRAEIMQAGGRQAYSTPIPMPRTLTQMSRTRVQTPRGSEAPGCPKIVAS